MILETKQLLILSRFQWKNLCNNTLTTNSPSGSKTHEHTTHDDDRREDLEDYQKSTVE